jgi:hypothetical protein
MLIQAHTTMLLANGALGAGFARCRPVDVPKQHTRAIDAADVA